MVAHYQAANEEERLQTSHGKLEEAAFWDAYGARHQRECSLHDNVVALLSACAEAGLSHSLLSSLPQAELSAAVERLGLAGRFVHVSGHGDYHAGSKLERGHALMAELGLERDAVVLIGDTTHDFDVAAAPPAQRGRVGEDVTAGRRCGNVCA